MLWTKLVVLGVLVTSLPLSDADVTLNILHTSDFRTQYEEFNGDNDQCSAHDLTEGQCFGGIARLATAVKEAREQLPNTLLLDAGDRFFGTLFFGLFGGDIVQYFMNLIGYDVMTLGELEFINQPAGLAPFLKSVNFSVVSASIDSSNEPILDGLFTKSVRRTVGYREVGIVGYTLDSFGIARPGLRLEFLDIVSSVQAEVQRLQESGVDIIIALGHAGFDVDKQVADIPGVDVVIGGHTGTFLYTGDPPSSEEPEGPYPYVTTTDGQTTLVAQCFTMGKYLCRLEVTFNDQGDVISFGGNPRLLDTSVTTDALSCIVTFIECMQPTDTLSSMGRGLVPTTLNTATRNAGHGMESRTVVGRSLVRLEGDVNVCSVRECNMGNLIADSMIFRNLGNGDEFSWNDVSISLTNTGTYFGSFDRGDILMSDILELLPFGNPIGAITIKGRYLRAALEHSVSQLDPCDPSKDQVFPGFLQVSGLLVKYDLRKPVGHRVVAVDALCTRCLDPVFEPLQDDKIYKVVIGTFLAEGGRGHSNIADNAIEFFNIGPQTIPGAGDRDADLLVEYIQALPVVYTTVGGRLQFVDGSDECDARSSYAPKRRDDLPRTRRQKSKYRRNYG